MAPRQRAFTTRADVDTPESSTLLSDRAKGAPKKPPMLNQTEADIARDWHDYFNLIALVRRRR